MAQARCLWAQGSGMRSYPSPEGMDHCLLTQHKSVRVKEIRSEPSSPRKGVSGSKYLQVGGSNYARREVPQGSMGLLTLRIWVIGSTSRKPDLHHNNQSVEIEAVIWDRDSHGLFDYEHKNMERHSIKVTGCRKFYFKSNSLDIIAREEQRLKALLPNVDDLESQAQQ